MANAGAAPQRAGIYQEMIPQPAKLTSTQRGKQRTIHDAQRGPDHQPPRSTPIAHTQRQRHSHQPRFVLDAGAGPPCKQSFHSSRPMERRYGA